MKRVGIKAGGKMVLFVPGPQGPSPLPRPPWSEFKRVNFNKSCIDSLCLFLSCCMSSALCFTVKLLFSRGGATPGGLGSRGLHALIFVPLVPFSKQEFQRMLSFFKHLCETVMCV